MIQRSLTRKRLHGLVGVVLAAGLIFQCYQAFRRHDDLVSQTRIVGPAKSNPNVAYAMPTSDTPRYPASLEELAGEDPLRFFKQMLDRYDQRVRDYTCTFTKQELVGGALTEEQVIDVHFREQPFSVLFKWVKNEDKCSRVLYVEDRWVKDGLQMALVEPGVIARLFVPYVMRQIDGKDAYKSSRRTINQFGLRNSLALVIQYCELAQSRGLLDFTYLGSGEVDGRPTLVFERHLPYTGEDCEWPDRVLVVHVDKELQMPILCVAYADDAKTQLLGKYLTTDIKLNVNLPDSVFTKEGMGL
ncbi:MAG: DUF1571 domain-containing protein [Phycisphaerales bacterium]|nr:DUF1571 domain-containing protein [Phycisphaerales bacterium]